MTSDAKVGLLLGLVFIVVIAFLINGLPDLLGNVSPRDVVSTSAVDTNTNFGLSDQAQSAIEKVREYKPLNIQKRQPSIDRSQIADPRFTIGISSGNIISSNTKPANNKRSFSHKNFYFVKSGDNLGKIAISVYGKELGNKFETVENLFKANSDKLKSPDDIYVGQKLRIPSVGHVDNVAAVNKLGNHSITAAGSGMFEKVSVAIKNVLRKPSSRPSHPKYYEVQDGDSLWQIASEVLGSGNRYEEILIANDHILDSADDLSVGMKLKMPRK